MSLLSMANELLLNTVQFLDSERDIDALARCNKRLYGLLIAHLYLFNVRHSDAYGLIWAAEEGRLDTLNRAIAAGVRLQDHALLHTAARNGHKACVDLLLALPGVDINVRNDEGLTAVDAASRNGHLDVVKSFLVADADLRASTHGKSTLHFAARFGHTEIVTLLLAHGADVSKLSDHGYTPLRCAALEGHHDIVKLLLEHGANVHATASEDSFTPLHLAALSGHDRVVKLLLDHGALTDFFTQDAYTALILAVESGNVASVKALIAKAADVNLHGENGCNVASDNGFVKTVQVLLESGANNVDLTFNREGWTLLRTAAVCDNIDMIDLLLAHGADVNATDDDGWSALLHAARHRRRDAVEALLCHGADHSATNRFGSTALHLASIEGNVDIVNLLLTSGADYTIGDKSGWSPMHMAARANRSNVVELFLRIPRIDINVQDHNGRTPFYHAVMRGHVDVVNVFLAHGASVAIPDYYGALPIYAAVRNGHKAVARRLLAADNYDNCQLDCFGYSLLAWAKRSRSLTLMQLVRQHVQQQDAVAMNPSDEPETPSGFAIIHCPCLCKVCTRRTAPGTNSFECPTCDGGYFLVCAECHAAGVGCRDSNHVLVPHLHRFPGLTLIS
ncbi:hypothetical protein E4U55_001250 [Claviceps digitariae]|nr:hypothetical protein E4U55_001250 [Claviceps digitariae]